MQNKEIMDSLLKKNNSVNPFLTVMFFKMSYRTWINYSKRVDQKKKRERQIADTKRHLLQSGKIVDVGAIEDSIP